MSTVSTIGRRAPLPPEPDPYRYGWRYVTVIDPDGTETVDQIPLTLEDVLFPEEGDFIVQTDAHDSDAMYLKGVFKSRLAGDPSAAVVSDCRVDWNLEGVQAARSGHRRVHRSQAYRDWATLNVKAEGARPLLVVEVTSRDTRKNDLELKPDFYRRARVPLYVIADVTKETDFEREIKLIAYALTDDDYVTVGARPSGMDLARTGAAVAGDGTRPPGRLSASGLLRSRYRRGDRGLRSDHTGPGRGGASTCPGGGVGRAEEEARLEAEARARPRRRPG